MYSLKLAPIYKQFALLRFTKLSSSKQNVPWYAKLDAWPRLCFKDTYHPSRRTGAFPSDVMTGSPILTWTSLFTVGPVAARRTTLFTALWGFQKQRRDGRNQNETHTETQMQFMSGNGMRIAHDSTTVAALCTNQTSSELQIDNVNSEMQLSNIYSSKQGCALFQIFTKTSPLYGTANFTSGILDGLEVVNLMAGAFKASRWTQYQYTI